MKRTKVGWHTLPTGKRIKVIYNPSNRQICCAIAKANGEPIPLRYDLVHLRKLAEEQRKRDEEIREKQYQKALKELCYYMAVHYDRKEIELSTEERKRICQDFLTRAMQ